MKKRLILCLVLTAATTALCENVISVGGRRHVQHGVFHELPFGKHDWSYGVAYEYHEVNAYWQFGSTYTPEVTGKEGVEYVVTPQINLIAKDNMWRAGVGGLKSYVRRGQRGGHWSDFYWQFMLGVGLPTFGLHLNVFAFYTFDDWNDLSDFDSEDIELGAWLGFRF